jgi:hypothetical protein
LSLKGKHNVKWQMREVRKGNLFICSMRMTRLTSFLWNLPLKKKVEWNWSLFQLDFHSQVKWLVKVGRVWSWSGLYIKERIWKIKGGKGGNLIEYKETLKKKGSLIVMLRRRKQNFKLIIIIILSIDPKSGHVISSPLLQGSMLDHKGALE